MNILEHVETFQDTENYFVVSKFMPAGDLLNYLMKQPVQPLQESQARRIIIQVAIGLQSLHERNILHRDIKIENILMSDFSEEAKVRIADLGSAIKLASPSDTTNFKIGTPGYVAPEVLQGLPYSFGCDVWSLGCLMHVLLTATPPFWNDDRKERTRKVCHEPLDLENNQYMAKLSDSCKELLILLLTKDPAYRPSISQVF
jgi:serine/threonine protein kinase